jgi:PadR family transcriptional regulator PadR
VAYRASFAPGFNSRRISKAGSGAAKETASHMARGVRYRTRGRDSTASLSGFLLLTLYTGSVIFVQKVDWSNSVPSGQTNLLQGTLDPLILKALALHEIHGLGISRRIEQVTKGTFQVKPGSLFPALHRMEEAGWLASFWGESENNRKAKYYRLTKRGRRQLDTETQQWERIFLAISSALQAT